LKTVLIQRECKGMQYFSYDKIFLPILEAVLNFSTKIIMYQND